MDIKSLSITELKQLLSRVNQDLSAIKRKENAAKKAAKLADNEYIAANKIAATFSGNNTVKPPVQNAKLIADIAIQKDILDYLNNGGHIICSNTTGKLNSKAVKGAKAGIRLYRKFAV